MVFDESFRWEADELYRKRGCYNPITESEKLLMHFAESDSFSLDDCKANLPTHEDIEHEKFKEWAESLIGLRLSVPKYWWFNEETKKHFTSMDKYLCEVTYILSFDSENPLFNIYCEGDGHDYPMEYCDVWKYSAKEDKISFCLPTKPPRLWIDKRLSELKREILQKLDCPDVPNSSQEDYGLDDGEKCRLSVPFAYNLSHVVYYYSCRGPEGYTFILSRKESKYDHRQTENDASSTEEEHCRV